MDCDIPKSGDPDPKDNEGCNIEEATLAIACANEDVLLAVEAKREVGLLWGDISKPPYTILFNEKLASRTVWRSICVLREVEKELATVEVKNNLPRGEMVAVHGNRMILRRVFQDPAIAAIYRDPGVSIEDLLSATREATKTALTALANLVQKKYADNYLATLFKNRERCRDLDEELSGGKPKPPVKEQGELWPP